MRELHTHFSATMAFGAFFAVLLMGTLWRLIAGYLTQSASSTVQNVGKVMAFQY